MARRTASLLVVLTLVLGACGDDDSGRPAPSVASGNAAGTFTTLCGGCHTFAAAGTTGGIGPNLDDEDPSRDEVLAALREGPGAMPGNLLGGAAAEEMADYVAGAAGG